MKRYLIIGAGIAGVLVALYLQKSLGDGHYRIQILDPHDEPLTEWFRNTRACGMRYLRSSSSHNVDTNFHSLRRYAAGHAAFDESDFIEPYRRPSVRLFNEHAQWVMDKAGIPSLQLQGRAERISRRLDGALITHTDNGEIESDVVILALGASAELSRPQWADESPEIPHIYENDFRSVLNKQTTKHLTIVGGGIGAAQHACNLIRRHRKQLTIVARHEPITSVFDFNPCYVGPSCLPAFLSTDSYQERRRILDRERYPGTMPPDVHAELQQFIEREMLQWITGEILSCDMYTPRTGYLLRILSEGSVHELQTDVVHLASGLGSRAGDHHLLRSVIREHNAPCDDHKTPVLSSQLEWIPGVFVTGRAAELEVGPPAGNIIGMHNAAKLISTELARRIQRSTVPQSAQR